MKPIVQRPDYDEAAGRLRALARTLAADLPLPIALSRAAQEQAGADYDQAVQSTESFERLLPGLILNVALCMSDFRIGEALARSPFPAESCADATGNQLQTEGAK